MPPSAVHTVNLISVPVGSGGRNIYLSLPTASLVLYFISIILVSPPEAVPSLRSNHPFVLTPSISISILSISLLILLKVGLRTAVKWLNFTASPLICEGRSMPLRIPNDNIPFIKQREPISSLPLCFCSWYCTAGVLPLNATDAEAGYDA